MDNSELVAIGAVPSIQATPDESGSAVAVALKAGSEDGRIGSGVVPTRRARPRSEPSFPCLPPTLPRVDADGDKPEETLSVAPTEVGSASVQDSECSSTKVMAFDGYDVPNRCRELLRRISLMTSAAGSPPWKWDILELLEESKDQLRDARKANERSDKGMWQEISEVLETEHTANTLPVGLRKQCEDLLKGRRMWLGDFDAELHAILARGRELRERLLFEDVDRAGWFSASGVSPMEVQRLLERHLDMHQRATRLARQLRLLSRALQQQGAVSSRRRAFQAKSMGEKLQSSLVCLAAVAVAPVPGSSEMWLATTTMMWLDKDQAWQHVVYEHPRDADIETILNQFQCRSSKARQALAEWLAMPPKKRRGCALIHNASVRRVIVKTHLVNCIDGYGDSSADWTTALDSHPLGHVMKKALTLNRESTDDGKVVIGAQRLAVVPLPPKPDTNWGWRGTFSYGDTKVGECRLREGGVFSFICVDCGLRVGDREEGDWRAEAEDDVGKGRSQYELALKSPSGEVIGGEAVGTLKGEITTLQAQTKEKDVEDVAAVSENAGEEPKTSIEVLNRTDENVQVKVFEHGKSGHASRLFRSAMSEGTVSPGMGRVFTLKATAEDPADTQFDVEIKISGKKAKCEVVGEQVIFVDGILVD